MATHTTPTSITYSVMGNSFASSNRIVKVRGPKGHFGRISSVNIWVTTTCAGATTTPIVEVGTATAGSAGEGKFFKKDLGTTAGSTLLSYIDPPNNAENLMAATVPNVLAQPDTDLFINLVAATGGGAAGVADVIIVIDWFMV